MGQELRLVEFRQLFSRLKRGVIWFDHLLLGLLVWIERRYIEVKAKSTVDDALDGFEPVVEDYVSPVYSEKPSETSTRLPEVRLTAPWYKEPD